MTSKTIARLPLILISVIYFINSGSSAEEGVIQPRQGVLFKTYRRPSTNDPPLPPPPVSPIPPPSTNIDMEDDLQFPPNPPPPVPDYLNSNIIRPKDQTEFPQSPPDAQIVYPSANVNGYGDDENRLNAVPEPTTESPKSVRQQTTSSSSFEKTPIVRTSLGRVGGKRVETRKGTLVNAFLGIPYAEPPRRFEVSERKEAWMGILNASSAGPHCMQDQPGWSENCLHLGILTPIGGKGPFPVLFVPHGGGFFVGGYNFFDLEALSDNLVSKNVILVLPNYRLGAAGFWSSQTADAPGNYGLWDLLSALIFTKQNIAAFGGDPDQITIWGQGSGAIASSALTLSPLSVGLYKRVILNSGSAFDPRLIRRDSRSALTFQQLAQTAGCDTAATRWTSGEKYKIVECLKAKNGQQLLRAQKEGNLSSALVWHPVVDGPGGILPEQFHILVRKRPSVPYLIGNAKDETAWDILVAPTIVVLTKSVSEFALDLPLDFEQVNNAEAVGEECEKYVTADVYENPIPARELCKLNFAARPAIAPGNDYWFRQAVRVGSSFAYFSPAMREVEAELGKGNKDVFLFSFDFVRSHGEPQSWWETVGAFHSLDLALSQNYFPHEIYKFDLEAPDRYVKEILLNTIRNFARSGNPSLPERNITWTPVSVPTGYNYLSIDYPTRMMDYYHVEDVLFWNSFIPLIESAGPSDNEEKAAKSPILSRISDSGLPVLDWIQKFFPPGLISSYVFNQSNPN